ncbi:MAG: hypothetical protein H7246_00620 [Phycisphaerae bacterium]|nr:hypothetical protein [Saprospiraceae bacterium]
MKNFLFLPILALFYFQVSPASAQSKTTTYLALGYHKIAPEMNDDFLKLAQAWKKIVAYKVNTLHTQGGWSLSKMVSPRGASSEYDYVTLNVLTGTDQLANYLEKPFLPDNWKSLLTVEEIDLVLRADAIRAFVKTEVWSTIDQNNMVPSGAPKPTVTVYNYFKQPAGKTREDHTKMEQEIWKPIHDARVKDGNLEQWLLLGLEFPFGASLPYDMITIDAYADMKQYLSSNFDDYFKKVHPGKSMKKLLRKTDVATTLVKGDVRIIIDRL